MTHMIFTNDGENELDGMAEPMPLPQRTPALALPAHTLFPSESARNCLEGFGCLHFVSELCFFKGLSKKTRQIVVLAALQER